MILRRLVSSEDILLSFVVVLSLFLVVSLALQFSVVGFVESLVAHEDASERLVEAGVPLLYALQFLCQVALWNNISSQTCLLESQGCILQSYTSEILPKHYQV